MEDDYSVDSLPGTPASDIPVLTVSPADTSLEDLIEDSSDVKSEDKKPAKKRKSWGQELPVPKTNLPPRYVFRNSLAASSSLECSANIDVQKTGKD